jgi:hypothetical protein
MSSCASYPHIHSPYDYILLNNLIKLKGLRKINRPENLRAGFFVRYLL